MNLETLQNRRQEAGFTLVELAIVMIIIGLLIGGILKGQELIANAQLTATVAQIKGIDGALSTFRDKYSTLPGDMRTPNNRLRDCTAAPCNDAGNGDGRIDNGVTLGSAPTITREGVVAFTHMAAADLISGVDINGTLNFGSAMPEAKIGGGFWIGHTANGSGNGVTGMRPGHYLIFNATPAAVSGSSTTGLTSTQAAQVDRKIDDGQADAGDLQSAGSGCHSSGTYNEANTASNCSMYMRIQS